MVRIEEWPEDFRQEFLDRDMPDFGDAAFVTGKPLKDRRVALISTAGLHRRGDRPFTEQSGDMRLIPAGTPDEELIMSHVSTNFDRMGFMQDADVAFPLNRLKELAAEGFIGSVAGMHYSFMGATPPEAMEGSVRDIVAAMRADNVDAVLLCPV